MQQHDKIINAAAKKVLAPKGLFRKGSSRIWLDDNGYFIIQVEFQPSGRSKGSYLNVGISFLWGSSKALNDSLAFDYGDRVYVDGKQFVPYSGNDEGFMIEMEQFADVALQKVMEYRQFKDLTYAKKQLVHQVTDTPEKRRFWEPYNAAMLCFLKGDCEDGKKFFSSFMHVLKNSFYDNGFYIEWHEEFYNHCIQCIQPYLNSKENAQKMILEMIKRRRNFFSSISSYKKMNKEIEKSLCEVILEDAITTIGE